MRRPLSVIILGIGMIVLAGCVTGQPAKDSSDSSTPAEWLADAGVLVDGNYFVDTTASIVKWRGEKVIGSSHDGTVKFNSGRVTITGGRFAGGEFVIDMKTIETDQDIAQLENHLRSPDFFDVENHSEAKLTITGVRDGTETGSYEVTGDLTIKGKTVPITFAANVGEAEGRLKATSSFSIDRTAWDIRYGSDKFFKDLGDTVIKDEIDLFIDLEAQR